MPARIIQGIARVDILVGEDKQLSCKVYGSGKSLSVPPRETLHKSLTVGPEDFATWIVTNDPSGKVRASVVDHKPPETPADVAALLVAWRAMLASCGFVPSDSASFGTADGKGTGTMRIGNPASAPTLAQLFGIAPDVMAAATK